MGKGFEVLERKGYSYFICHGEEARRADVAISPNLQIEMGGLLEIAWSLINIRSSQCKLHLIQLYQYARCAFRVNERVLLSIRGDARLFVDEAHTFGS